MTTLCACSRPFPGASTSSTPASPCCAAARFRPLTSGEIERYIATGEPMDKAGAYGIQGRGALFVAHLDGDYFNVMGLPLCRLGQLLNELGVELL